jgi:Secretion system C-terminal sorting domain
MKYFFLSLLLFTSFFAPAQDILWEKSYGGKHADYLFDAQPTADYGFILAGSSLSNKSGNKEADNHGDLDYFVWKMNEKGDLDWQKSLGGNGFDLLQSIKGTSDGGFILAGTSDSKPLPSGESGTSDKKDACKGLSDFWVIKLDAKGNEQWQKTIGGSGQDELLCAFQTKDGGYMLGGTSSSSPKGNDNQNDNDNQNNNENKETAKIDLYTKSEYCRGNTDYWIVKLDRKGDIQWQKTYGGAFADALRAMEQTQDGGYILGGYSNSPASTTTEKSPTFGGARGGYGEKTDDNKGVGDYWIIKIDALGVIQWQRTYGGDGDDQLYALHQTPDGGYIAGGNSNSSGALTAQGGVVKTGTDYWVLQLDAKGNVVWSQTYDFGKTDILTSLVENKDGTFLIGGYSSPNPSEGGGFKIGSKKDKEGINDYMALKISATGETLWKKTVGSAGEDILRKLIETRDGGYLLAGTSSISLSPMSGAGAGGANDRKSAVGSNDFWVVKLKDKTKPDVPKTNVEALPNPATSFTNIIVGYEYANGTATVVDMAGRVLQTFAITTRTIPVDLSHYPDGVYIVNINTNVQHDGVKVIKSTEY